MLTAFKNSIFLPAFYCHNCFYGNWNWPWSSPTTWILTCQFYIKVPPSKSFNKPVMIVLPNEFSN